MYAMRATEFNQNYESIDATAGIYRKKGTVFAQRYESDFEVAVKIDVDENGGDNCSKTVLLRGVAGDYVVRPVGRLPYVVPSNEFEQLYEIANDRMGKQRGRNVSVLSVSGGAQLAPSPSSLRVVLESDAEGPQSKDAGEVRAPKQAKVKSNQVAPAQMENSV